MVSAVLMEGNGEMECVCGSATNIVEIIISISARIGVSSAVPSELFASILIE